MSEAPGQANLFEPPTPEPTGVFVPMEGETVTEFPRRRFDEMQALGVKGPRKLRRTECEKPTRQS